MPAKGKQTKATKPARATAKQTKAKGADPMALHKKTGLPPSRYMKDLPRGGDF